jgi:tRNA threonylcarbamoyladenosine biosynthesis protein TsaB
VTHDPLAGATLALDAATYAGSVAVLRGGEVLAERTVAMRGEREERLMPAVAEALGESGVQPRELVRIVCGAGPGSFTSLRIAASIAKGIAAGAEVPLFAVSSLTLVVAGARPALPAGRYVAALDAMRGESFAALVDVDAAGRAIERGAPALLDGDALAALARRERARVLGPRPGDGGVHPHARGVARLADLTGALAPAELAGWEPDYGRLAEAQVKWERAHGRALPRA